MILGTQCQNGSNRQQTVDGSTFGKTNHNGVSRGEVINETTEARLVWKPVESSLLPQAIFLPGLRPRLRPVSGASETLSFKPNRANLL